MKYICVEKFHPYYHKLEIGEIYNIVELPVLISGPLNFRRYSIDGWGEIYEEQFKYFVKLSVYRDNRISEIFDI